MFGMASIKLKEASRRKQHINTRAYQKNPAATYGGKIDSLAGKRKIKDTISVYAGR